MTRDSRPGTDWDGPPGTAIQLHTLASMSDPLETVVRRVAAAGYDGVEFAGQFLSADPARVRSALAATGTAPVAAHVGLSRLEANPERVVDQCRTVGCRRVVVPHVGANHFLTTAAVDGLAARLAALSDRLAADGVELAYHNSLATLSPPLDQFGLERATSVPLPLAGWRRIADGLGRVARLDEGDIVERTALGRIRERTPDALTFEVDVGWVAAAGYDPVAVIDLLDERLAAVHVADVSVTSRFPRAFGSVPPGIGLIDLGRVLPAARASAADWLVYEDDDPADAERAMWDGIEFLSPAGSGRPEAAGDGPEGGGQEPQPGESVVEPQQSAGDD